MFRELVEYRHLLLTLTWRDIRIRYKQTLMGFLWALLMPALTVAAGLVVRKAFAVVQGTALEATTVRRYRQGAGLGAGHRQHPVRDDEPDGQCAL